LAAAAIIDTALVVPVVVSHDGEPEWCPARHAEHLRAIAQYDSSRRRLLTDFLSSYEPRPGTVVYVGYGSLLERRDFLDGRWVPGEGIYRTTQRGLFLKASYLYPF
jgi:hypothetical protein